MAKSNNGVGIKRCHCKANNGFLIVPGNEVSGLFRLLLLWVLMRQNGLQSVDKPDVNVYQVKF